MFVERQMQEGMRRKRMQGTFMEPTLQPAAEPQPQAVVASPVEETMQGSPLDVPSDISEEEMAVIEEITGSSVGAEPSEEEEVVVEMRGEQGELPL